MSDESNSIKVIHPVETKEGAGATVKRLFPTSKMDSLDPFVLLDEFFVNPDVGFPDHPHGGFEAITYMLEGSFGHKDNIGNDYTVGPGGIQKFTAGKGIVHSEIPGSDEMSHGFQLWVNLPKKMKNIEPSYDKIEAKDVPVKSEDGVTIKTIVGKRIPIEFKTGVDYRDIKILKDKSKEIKISGKHNGLIYLYKGMIEVENKSIEPSTAIVFRKINRINITALKDSEFVLISGKPLNEPINLRGSFVK